MIDELVQKSIDTLATQGYAAQFMKDGPAMRGLQRPSMVMYSSIIGERYGILLVRHSYSDYFVEIYTGETLEHRRLMVGYALRLIGAREAARYLDFLGSSYCARITSDWYFEFPGQAEYAEHAIEQMIWDLTSLVENPWPQLLQRFQPEKRQEFMRSLLSRISTQDEFVRHFSCIVKGYQGYNHGEYLSIWREAARRLKIKYFKSIHRQIKACCQLSI